MKKAATFFLLFLPMYGYLIPELIGENVNGFILFLALTLSVCCFVAFNIHPLFQKTGEKRLDALQSGILLTTDFLVSCTINVIVAVLLAFAVPDIISLKTLIIHIVIVVLYEFVLFWNGIIRLYCTSVQLGIKWRVLGIVFGLIPIANLIMLIKIIRLSSDEYKIETEKTQLDDTRKESEICKTKYPILLVHGVFFRDIRFFNYWGRIPSVLIKNGAEVYYGQQQSAASVADSAKELFDRIEKIINETGCEKVNIIAHSKGGLDSRYAISLLGADQYVASLTTINTPHRGCLFADYLLKKIPEKVRNGITDTYNSALKKLGDSNPDFIGAVNDLTEANCEELNKIAIDSKNVYYRSVGSKMNRATSGKFPLNFSYHLVKHFDGPKDGLVSAESAKWGEEFTLIETKGNRGVSHGDVIDLNRENIPGFDVREFYVNLVSELKQKGF